MRKSFGQLLFASTLICAARSQELKGQISSSAADGMPITVVIHAQVPTDTGTVYLTGNRPEIGNWNPRFFEMNGEGRERIATLRLPPGTELEYKFTLGSWDYEALGPSGKITPNNRLIADGNKEVTNVLSGFKKGASEYLDDWKGSGVLGRLIYWRNLPSKFLSATRHIEIWLPPGYDDNSTNRYDVLYMHDGQNLFDPRLASTGVDWGVDEAIVRGMNAGKIPPMIVVGVWCTDQRLREYSPWDLGTNYARFLIEELMPKVNREFRTLTGPQHTAVMGSSMGGLISFWLCWKHPEVFGSAGCMSTAFTWTGRIHNGDEVGTPLIENELNAGGHVPKGIRLYFDYGTKGFESMIEPEQKKVNAWLVSQGLKEVEDFTVRKIEGAEHNEAAWRTRLDMPLEFIFGKRAPLNGHGH